MGHAEPPISDIDRVIRRLEVIGKLSAAERRAVQALPMRVKSLAADTDVVVEGERPKECCVVLEGLACRYKLVAGGQRQILSFHIAGDLPDLQSLHLDVMDHTIGALTPLRVGFVAHAAIDDITQRFPGVASLFWRETLIDAAVFREWVANVGRRTARQRIAHIICEMHLRMESVGLAQGEEFELPLTQAEFGDAAALTSVHVNRVFQVLRAEGLLASRGKFITVPDWPRLQKAGDFNPAYLHLRHPYRGAAS